MDLQLAEDVKMLMPYRLHLGIRGREYMFAFLLPKF